MWTGWRGEGSGQNVKGTEAGETSGTAQGGRLEQGGAEGLC